MRRREGPAMTFKKSVLDTLPPIPHERIATFYGDDWFWRHCYKRGFPWFRDLGNVVFHHVGSSILKLGFRAHKKKEWNEWQKIKAELL